MAVKAKSKSGGSVQEPIVIKKLQHRKSMIIIVGDSPLIVNAWNQKAKLQMLKTHMGGIKIREAKNPYDDFLRTMYRMDDGAYGFPVVGIKEAMATAATDLENIAKSVIYRNVMVTGRRGFQIAAFADLKTPQELAELFSPNAPSMREDMVKTSGMNRAPDIRYRAEYWPWAMRFNLSFLGEFIETESVLNLLQQAGFRVGLAEWRQEKGGTNGAFHVAEQHEIVMVEKWIKAGQKEPAVIDAKAWLANLTGKSDEKEDDNVGLLAAAGQVKTRKAGNGKSAELPQ